MIRPAHRLMWGTATLRPTAPIYYFNCRLVSNFDAKRHQRHVDVGVRLDDAARRDVGKARPTRELELRMAMHERIEKRHGALLERRRNRGVVTTGGCAK